MKNLKLELQELAAALSHDSLHRSIQNLLCLLIRAAGADVGEIFLAQPNGKGMVLTWLEGPFKSAFSQKYKFAKGEGFPGRVLETGKSIFSKNLKENETYLREKVKKLGFNSYLCVPVLEKTQTIASIHLAFRSQNHDLENAEKLLYTASPFLSVRIQAAFFHLQETIMSSHQNLRSLLQEVLQTAAALCSAHGGNLYLVRTDNTGVFEKAFFGCGSENGCHTIQTGSNKKESSGICPALNSCESVLLSRSDNQKPVPCHFDPHKTALSYCIPFGINKDLNGLLEIIYRTNPPFPFSQNIPLLEWISRKVSARIHDFLEKKDLTDISEIKIKHPKVEDKPDDRSGFLKFFCFGPFRFYVRNTLITSSLIKRKKSLILLKILLTFRDRFLSSDELIDLLWPEENSSDLGKNRLHVLFHFLRRMIEPAAEKKNRINKWDFLQREENRYRLHLTSECYSDVEEFNHFLKQAEEARLKNDLNEAKVKYEKGISLYQGDYLMEESFAEWCWIKREELKQKFLDASRKLIIIYEKNNEWDKGVSTLNRALQIDPYREEFYRFSMRFLWNEGKRDDALRQYEICREKLEKELKIPLLSETKELAEKIKAGKIL